MFEMLNHWHWFIAAVLLVCIEIIAPGAYFLWMGISAAVVGFITLVAADLAWTTQLILFAIFSVVSIVLYQLYLRKHPTKTDLPLLSRRGEQYIGRIFTLSEPIVNGEGKIKVDDTTWKVHGEDCENCTKVKVVGVQSTVFQVEHVDQD